MTTSDHGGWSGHPAILSNTTTTEGGNDSSLLLSCIIVSATGITPGLPGEDAAVNYLEGCGLEQQYSIGWPACQSLLHPNAYCASVITNESHVHTFPVDEHV
ncbi:hypothetical protein ANO14919_122570 [Xylariales sp. No.14919]|nr:hypothetical protein ANO14919_122570 [Xylariales sp. No.14919]